MYPWLPQEVYAKLTVFPSVYLRSVPITRQDLGSASRDSLHQTNSGDRRSLFSQPTVTAERRALATQTIETMDEGKEVKFLCKFNTWHLIAVTVTTVHVLTATPAIFLQNVCCELITFFFLIHGLFTLICDYFCKGVYVWGAGLRRGVSISLCTTRSIFNDGMLRRSFTREHAPSHTRKELTS